MNLEYVPVRGQKFEVGRVINLTKCNCPQCTFMRCPKKNYALKMARKKYDVSVFWVEWKDKILELNRPDRWQYSFHGKYSLRLTYDMINDFFDILHFTFPKGTYWAPNNPRCDSKAIRETVYKEISLVKFSRAGREVPVATIEIAGPTIHDYDMSARQQKLAEKIQENLKWIKEKIFEHYQEKDEGWKIGWLSPDGRHYPCSHCEHELLARQLGSNELMLEGLGWVKVFSEDEDGFYRGMHFMPAEQRNWLSLNGYILDD